MPRYNSKLGCFNKTVSFNVPDTIVRSTTADIVRTKGTRNDQQAQKFSDLRESLNFKLARLAWHDARMAFESATSGSDIRRLDQDLQQASGQYLGALLNMAENGIWNCGEFADFALMIIDKLAASGVFDGNYLARGVSLNNPNMPEKEQYKNHDHAFVLIMDRQEKPIFVIDLWHV